MAKTISDLPATTLGRTTDLFEKTDGVSGESEKITGAQIASMTRDGAKVYRALLTQSSNIAPTAEVLENTLGGVPVWTRSSTGVYFATLAGAFSGGKTFSLIAGSLTSPISIPIIYEEGGVVKVLVTDADGNTVDDALNRASVEVRTYP